MAKQKKVKPDSKVKSKQTIPSKTKEIESVIKVDSHNGKSKVFFLDTKNLNKLPIEADEVMLVVKSRNIEIGFAVDSVNEKVELYSFKNGEKDYKSVLSLAAMDKAIKEITKKNQLELNETT